MYCKFCGAKNIDGAKFCKSCGKEFRKISVHKNTSTYEIPGIGIQIIFMMAIILLSIYFVINVTKKEDISYKKIKGLVSADDEDNGIDFLEGTWEIDDLGADTKYNGYIIEFYSPDQKNGSAGSLRYINNQGWDRRGQYSYHESSETLEIALYDEFDVENDWTVYFTFSVAVEDNDYIRLDSEKYIFDLIRLE